MPGDPALETKDQRLETFLRALYCAALVFFASPVFGQSTSSAAQPAYAQLRLIAPAAPGGGWDQTARVMQQVLQQTGIARLAPVENIPGAAGTIGLARFIGAERGNGDAVLVSGLIMLGGIVTNGSPVTLADATPLAKLTGEFEVIVVPKASPYQSLGEFLAAFKTRPEAISWGGGSAGGSDQILAGLVAEAVGVSPARVNYIAFSGGGEAMSAIIGGQVTAGVNGLAEMTPQIEAGTVRALAISSRERLPGLDVPTLHEQGVEVEFENWRSLLAPPGISREDRARLESAIGAMVASGPWREALQRYRWIDRYMAGEPFVRYVESEEKRVRGILRQFGTDNAAPRTLLSEGPYPIVVLAGLLIFSCLAVVHIRAHPSAVDPAAEPVRWTSIAWLGLGIVAYLLLAEPAGFVIASAGLFWCTARAFASQRPLRDAVFSVVISIGAYLLFARLLQLALPAGVLAGWL
jgi:putative tricarboxylic transport membrane protein